MGSCRRESDSHYTCPTLYGKDSCSPRKGQTNKGKNALKIWKKYKSNLGESYYFKLKNHKSFFFCNKIILIGNTFFSISRAIWKGTNCAYPCELEVPALGHDYYFCYTRRDNSTWEYCGNWDVPQEKVISQKKIINFQFFFQYFHETKINLENSFGIHSWWLCMWWLL